jgi:hypothetical protein
MNYNSDFKFDLQLGIVGEKYLNDILSNKKIEVKTDFQAMQTGNLFIEYESRNKPSGISTSEADFYCFIISNEHLILIKTNQLKEICRPFIGTKRDITGGDSDTSKGILLPIQELWNTKAN